MFQNLGDRLSKIFSSLTGKGALKEADVLLALREIRVALLEADVALPVVKSFVESIQEKATGQTVLDSITPGQMVIKIVHDELVTLLGSEAADLNLATTPPAVILMAGLQGSGKTTSTAKLAKWVETKLRKKVMMASLDTYRPAAQEQLKQLGERIAIATLPIIENEKPLEITKRALKEARLGGYDVLLLDTAGRLHVDEALMEEVVSIHKEAKPIETLLVADAMTGQDAVNVAKSFKDQLPLTGIILTRLDGDARGGAALSMRQVTGCPIKFVGLGEKTDAFDVFHPDRMAGRILDKGDIVSLVEKAAETLDREEAEKLNRKLQKGTFDLNDMASQLQQMLKMGGISQLMGLLPGIGSLKDKMPNAKDSDKSIRRQIAIVRSMTPKERRYYKLLNASRKKRVALGAGATVQEVNVLIKQYEGALKMMKKVNKLGKKGLLRQGLGGLFSR
ncbi:MAG: signal recognition particle protein [Alphaproteobacteria bacterium]|nr:signal recognition particle protein [Alphaproteobacteria bacterium]